MASDSPRTRINQFFASNKRKSLSPGSKRGRTQKEARIVLESSPNGKGNLDNYLVSSQDDKLSDTPRGGSVALVDPVKRNLALKINRVSEDGGKEQLLLAQLDSQTIPKGGETVHKETSQDSSNAGIVTKRLEHGGENSELKQFAMEYLSLYCSELKSTATSPSKAKLNDHKRHSSSLLSDGENKTTKKRNCMVNRSLSEGEMACSDQQITEISKTSDSILKTLKEVDAGSDSVQLQHSLRNCIQLSASKVNMTECSTPSPSIVTACVRETPKSTRGSSLFLPGEEFWNEAIQISDGLSVADFPLNNVAEKLTVLVAMIRPRKY